MRTIKRLQETISSSRGKALEKISYPFKKKHYHDHEKIKKFTKKNQKFTKKNQKIKKRIKKSRKE